MRALEVAKRLAKDGAARLTVVHAVQPTFQAVEVYPYVVLNDPTGLNVKEEEGRRLLKEATAMLEEAGIHAESQLLIGSTGEEICRFAKSGEFDLIVLGRRGVSRLEEVILGSVSGYVVRHSHLPVLIVQ